MNRGMTLCKTLMYLFLNSLLMTKRSYASHRFTKRLGCITQLLSF